MLNPSDASPQLTNAISQLAAEYRFIERSTSSTSRFDPITVFRGIRVCQLAFSILPHR
ncbi:MAG: hypothetical protein IPP33_03870 [Flavobacteriales bacterium]|nr:hypothetical protein [Flavobacteriales bacterium]